MLKEKLNSNSIALAGEFLVLAKLTLLGHIATLTLGNTKSIDILVSSKRGKMLRVEVKTSTKESGTHSQFGNALFWHMHQKHEFNRDKSLIYCFVYLKNRQNFQTARIFIVPSENVAEYVKEQDRHYHEDLPHRKITKHTPLRMFRIALDAKSHGLPAKDFEDKWSYFD